MVTFQAILSRFHLGRAEESDKKTCITCHFLVTCIQLGEGFQVRTAMQKLGDSLEAGDIHALYPREAACYYDKYLPISIAEPERLKEEMAKSRDKCPRFWRFRQLMSTKDAEHLQDFDLHQRTALTAARLSTLGLIVAAICSFLAVLERLFEFGVSQKLISFP